MEQSIIASDYKITFGGLVLIDAVDGQWLFGDEKEVLKIKPEFGGVEAVTFVGGGARTFERAGGGNRFHTLEFAVIRQHATVMAAKVFEIKHLGDLPAGGVDAVMTVTGYLGSAILKKASIMDASSHTLHNFSIFQYQLKGGAFPSSLTLSPNIADEAGTNVTDQTGTVIQQQ